MSVLAILATIWRWRFPIAILLGLAAAGGIWLRLDYLNAKIAHYKAEREELISTNQATMEALDEIKAEKAKNERLLTDRAARKSKEADQLGALVKRILSHDASTDCPVSPAVNDALDGGLL